jgi:SAM-dependent methyltransferase
MDDIARYNKERWEELARANVAYSRPALTLDPRSAREMLDPYAVMGDVEGKDVLCLASGGGQQSVAFGLLGARVTVYDLSETQLMRDREAAAHHGLSIRIVQGDMRDLGRFDERAFDFVWHAHSLNFVSDARQVYRQVARVIRPGGLYRMSCSNPFVMGIDERDWNGEAYPLNRPYVDGGELEFEDPYWEVWDDDGSSVRVKGPKEFRHTLSTLVNGLIECGFVLLGLWEEESGDPQAEPGTWEHFTAIAPPYLAFWARYRPDVCAQRGCGARAAPVGDEDHGK